MEKKVKGSSFFIIFALFGIGIIAYFQVYKKNPWFYLNKGYKSAIESDFAGIVKSKVVEHNNHNNNVIVFYDQNKIIINGYFWDKIQIGDSICKVKGDSVIQVFRNRNKIILELAPFYESAMQREKDK